MDDSEKLMALKKAYAEIILNTAKEAAARVMVSEKKALRFQQELFSTKEEALRMLLRLKQMLDSKVTEAEVTSLSQQKKIEELEAQLQEAEDIVRDLREELREVQDKLEEVTNDQLQPLEEHNLAVDTAIHEEISQENGLMDSKSIFSLPPDSRPFTASDMKNFSMSGAHAGNKCYGENDPHMDNCYLPNPYFASIVMRSKEPELYRNGCTQRIRAFEKYLLDGKLSFTGKVDDVKNEVFAKGGEEGKGVYKTSIQKHDDMLGVEEKNQDELTVINTDSSQIPVQAVKSICRKRRKRATKFKKIKAPSCKQVNGMHVIPTHEAENILGVEGKNLDEVKTMQPNVGDIHLEVVKSFCRKRKRAARYIKSKDPSCSSLADQVIEMHQISDLCNSKTSPGLVENSSEIIENEGQMNTVSTEGMMSHTDLTAMELGSVDLTENDVEFVRACGARNTMNNGTDLINISDMTRQESLSAGNSEVQECRTDVETIDESLLNSDLKADSNDVVSQTVTNRFLKYTFTRKRKKESLYSPDGNSSLDNERKAVEKRNVSPEPRDSSLTNESSRDSRRLAQVARQLISLSEKKWWK